MNSRNLPKRFLDLSEDEARDIIQRILQTCYSEAGIRGSLSYHGFHGDKAIILGLRLSGLFLGRVMVPGPRGTIIVVENR